MVAREVYVASDPLPTLPRPVLEINTFDAHGQKVRRLAMSYLVDSYAAYGVQQRVRYAGVGC